jgi:prepilin-type N-terminal cleavage/methylation domain-containing protein
MSKQLQKSGSGFTLLEMLISMAMGLIVLGSAVALFSKAMDANYQISQRAEMQQNGRAAADMIARDISLAGYGLPTGGVQLPLGGNGDSTYACGSSGCYTGYAAGSGPAGLVYPTVPAYGANPAVRNHLYGLMAGYQKGISLTNGTGASDVITMVYLDWTYQLNLFTVTSWAPNGSWITLTNPVNPPQPVPPLNDPVYGVKVGDLIMLTSTNGNAVGEVTNVAGNTITFADSDTLNINQSNATSGNIQTFIANTGAGVPMSAVRILVTTYYIDIPRGPDGALYTTDDGPPRLMRQVNAQPPMPVAENIMGLSVTYDVVDDSGNINANLVDGGLSNTPPVSPNQIRKVNVSVSARTPMKNASGVIRGYQTMTLATSVGARNMSFRDRYQ